MGKRYNLLSIALIGLLILAISGCETVPKKFKEEVGGIKTRVETLETRVDDIATKQAEVERASSAQAQTIAEMRSEGSQSGSNISIKRRHTGKASVKEIQRCLKNAGFYTGKIDGISGKNTRRAIKDFQRANSLNPDGIVGKKTWEILSRYAEAGRGTEEGAAK